jgi:hypothetical protein
MEVQDDVLDVVRRVKAISPRLVVYYNEQTDGFDIVEECLDGTDRLVFSVGALDQRVIDRLLLADHWGGNEVPTHIRPDNEDYVTEIDRDNAALQAAITRKQLDKVSDAGERMAWALKLPLKGNVGKEESIFVKRSPFAKDDES